MARVSPAHGLMIVSIVAWAALGAFPAAAQFNPFEALFGSPPRPPSGVPSGRQQTPYPQQQYPAQQYPDDRYPPSGQQYSRPGQPAVQSQPLAPPPGGTAAAVDPARSQGAQPL